jgi:hypothetical protein
VWHQHQKKSLNYNSQFWNAENPKIVVINVKVDDGSANQVYSLAQQIKPDFLLYNNILNSAKDTTWAKSTNIIQHKLFLDGSE